MEKLYSGYLAFEELIDRNLDSAIIYGVSPVFESGDGSACKELYTKKKKKRLEALYRICKVMTLYINLIDYSDIR